MFLPRPVLRAKLIPNLHSAGVNLNILTPKKKPKNTTFATFPKDLLSDLVPPLYLAGAWLFETAKLGKLVHAGKL